MITEELVYKMQVDIRKSIHSLNNGGCIHFAYYFSKALKSVNIPHRILLTNQEPIDIRYDYFEPVSHVLVYIPGIGYIDGYELFPTQVSYFDQWSNERYQRHFNLTNKKLNNLRNDYQWNRNYSISQNRRLEKIIQKHINGTREPIHKKR
jgi:hypothetical protein